jgi:hypothetical protein
MGPIASLDTEEKRNTSCPFQESNLTVQSLALHYTDLAASARCLHNTHLKLTICNLTQWFQCSAHTSMIVLKLVL